jgi:type II secretory ATPase GspE/PulE/Tfp pilus assembly ATPase PilB-like protein
MKTTVFADVFMAANGRLQQIAAKGFSIPLDMIAILLQGFVLHLCPSCGEAEPHK